MPFGNQTFDRCLRANGDGYIQITVPLDVADHLEAEIGDKIRFEIEETEDRKFVSMYKPGETGDGEKTPTQSNQQE